jgi:hypothetical protein
MAKSPFAKRDEQYELSRRALIKWTVAAGAALGVSRSKIFDILEGSAGRGVAYAAAANPTTRSVHIVAGNGGLAWFQLLWPQVDVAMAANPNFAWHRPGEATLVPGTFKPLAMGPDTPFATLPAARQMTGFLCGNNETHTGQPTSTTLLNGSNIHAINAVLQASSPSVIPVITVGQTSLGTAPGAPVAAQVGGADEAVGLFNSAASRAGGLLSMQGHASLYKAQYDAFAQLNRAAGRSTQKKSYTTASGAASFLGTNLEAKLAIQPADLTMYGIDGNTRANVRRIAEMLIFSVKAFKMGLTNSVVLPAMNDDPHGAFADGSVNTVPRQLKMVFDGFMTHLSETTDDVTLTTLADDIVFTISGDTTKSPLDRNGWPDGTPGNTNMLFVYGGGHLKTGWFGRVLANGNVEGFDANGAATQYNGANTARLALASVAYAVAKRDERLISPFANGITISGRMGNPKDQ